MIEPARRALHYNAAMAIGGSQSRPENHDRAARTRRSSRAWCWPPPRSPVFPARRLLLGPGRAIAAANADGAALIAAEQPLPGDLAAPAAERRHRGWLAWSVRRPCRAARVSLSAPARSALPTSRTRSLGCCLARADSHGNILASAGIAPVIGQFRPGRRSAR